MKRKEGNKGKEVVVVVVVVALVVVVVGPLNLLSTFLEGWGIMLKEVYMVVVVVVVVVVFLILFLGLKIFERER